MSAAAGCTPTPAPSCDGEGACDGLSGPTERQCIDFCVPRWDWASSGPCGTGPIRCPPVQRCIAGECRPLQWCALDPCEASLFSTSTNPLLSLMRGCPVGSSCAPDVGAPSPGLGVCRRDLTLLDACTAGADDCGDGLVCLDNTCPEASAYFSRSAPPSHPFCFAPRFEGQTCDSNAADLRDGFSTGCAPCEEGTFCAPRAAVDPDHPDADDNICVRECNGPNGLGDPSVCACGSDVVRCLPSQTPVQRADGQPVGPWFCTPCTPDGVAGCADTNGAACCDDQASCRYVTDVLTGAQRDVCCRAPAAGDPDIPPDQNVPAHCDAAARRIECCPGSFCDPSGTCQSCARAGESAGGRPCCPGTIAVTGGTCAACLDEREQLDLLDNQLGSPYCSSETFLVSSSTGQPPPTPASVDAAFVPSSAMPFPMEYDGAIGAFLTHTSGLTVFAQYALSPQHHTFLFDAPLAGSSTGFGGAFGAGTHVLELPPDDDRSPAATTVPLPDAFWTRFRIYDSGNCSALFSWTSVAAGLEVAFNRQIAEFQGTGDLSGVISAAGVTVSPIFDGQEGDIYGLLEARDRISISTSYTIGRIGDSVFGCNNATLAFSATASIAQVPGFNVGLDARTSDANLFADMGPNRICTIGPGGATFDCQMPVPPASGSRIWTTQLRSYPRGAGIYDWTDAGLPNEVARLDELFGAVECISVRDTYVCNLPHFTEDIYCCPSDPNCPVVAPGDPLCVDPHVVTSPFDTRRSIQCNGSRGGGLNASCPDPDSIYFTYRPLLRFDDPVELNDSTVLPGRPVDVVPIAHDVAVSMAPGDIHVAVSCDALQPIIELKFRSRSRLIAREATAALSDLLGSVFGRSATSSFGVPSSRLVTCTTDEECWAAQPFGEGRATCVGGVCDGVRLEPRRINVMPTGIEYVVAQTASDPQMALFSAAPISVGAFATLSCTSSRNYPPAAAGRGRRYSLGSYARADITVATPPRATQMISGASSAETLHGGPGSLEFCSGSRSARCLCPQTGTRCTNPDLLVAGFAAPPGSLGCRPPAGAPGGPLMCCNTAGTSCATAR